MKPDLEHVPAAQRRAGAPPVPGGRRAFHVDNLRALAMLLGVCFHAAMAYAPSIQPVWFLTDAQSSVGIDVLATFTHLFRVPLFFVLAGHLAHLSVREHGPAAFVRSRVRRLLWPFLAFLPLTWGCCFLIFRWAVHHLDELSPPMKLMRDAFEGRFQGEAPAPATGHLWFIYHLFFFCLLASCLSRFRPGWLRAARGALFGSAWHILWLPALLMPAAFVATVPVPAPESLVPQLWSFSYGGLFFAFGWASAGHPEYLSKVEPHLGKLAVFSAAAFVAYYRLFPRRTLADQMAGPTPTALTAEGLFTVGLQCYLATFLTLIAWALGERYLSRESKVLRYVSGSSYWVYLVHLPVLLWVQALIGNLDLDVWAKLAIAIGATSTISLLAYELFVRHTFLGAFLNGRRARREGHAETWQTAR